MIISLKKDILYKNWKKILRAYKIDKRYISDKPFPVFSVWNIYNSEKKYLWKWFIKIKFKCSWK